MVTFFIIVPTYNSENFLDRCLASLISTQPGNFGLRVHVQDGQSTDNTARIAERWKDRGVTFASEQDGGIFDALSKAATRLGPGDIMTWLGSDDVLMPGALATMASIFGQLPEVEWVTGLPFVANEAGESFTPCPQMAYTRADLAAGRHDGRKKGFVMQEGTFWRESLWNKVGGVDRRFKYAGEWDLWRRFAMHSPLYALTFPVARFSRRQGQTSEDSTSYYREVDATAALPIVADDFSYELVRPPWENEWRIQNRSEKNSWRFAPFLRSVRPRKG